MASISFLSNKALRGFIPYSSNPSSIVQVSSKANTFYREEGSKSWEKDLLKCSDTREVKFYFNIYYTTWLLWYQKFSAVLFLRTLNPPVPLRQTRLYFKWQNHLQTIQRVIISHTFHRAKKWLTTGEKMALSNHSILRQRVKLNK